MTITQTLRLSEPRDLIAHIPYRLGFRPAESAVLVSLNLTPRGTWRVGLVARMDLADLVDPRTGPAAAASLAGHVAATEPDEVRLILYTAGPDDLDLLDPVVDNLTEALEEELWPLLPDLDPWVVTGEGWGHLEPCDCCPAEGHPLAELSSSPAALTMALAGYGAVGDRARLAVERSTDATALAVAQAAAARARERRTAVERACGGAPLVRGAAFGVPGARPARDQAQLERWREESARLWDGAIESTGQRGPGTGAPPEVLGTLLVALADKIVRDAVVAAAMAGVVGRTAEYLDPDILARAFSTEAAPDRDVVGAAIALAHEVAAHAEPGTGGAALGLLAYLAWWGNEGARADVVARQALTEEPGHRLAELVVQALEAGMPPAWVVPR